MRISDWSSDVCSSDLIAALLLQRVPDGGGHIVLYPLFRRSTDMTQVQWPGASFTLDNRRIVHQGRKARAIQRGRHGQQPEIGARRLLRIKRQSQAKIANKAALMNLKNGQASRRERRVEYV